MAEQEFKVPPGVRRCASTGQLINGKQVIRPLRFFVSETRLQTIINYDAHPDADLECSRECQDAAMKIVIALRSIVESRLEELRKDKATQVACSEWCVCLYVCLYKLVRYIAD